MREAVKLTDLARGLDEPAPKVIAGELGVGLKIFLAAMLALAMFAAWSLRQRGPVLLSDQPLPKQHPVGQGEKLYSQPVRELMDYVAAIKTGRRSFAHEVPGVVAAGQLGYSRLFASAYDEVAYLKRTVPGENVIAALEKIIQEEQAVDFLMARNLLVTPITYLRALQNGETEFPAPSDAAPTPSAVVGQLSLLYPNTPLDPNDHFFAFAYRQSRNFAADRIERKGQISVFEIVGEFRRSVIQALIESSRRPENP